MWTSIVQDTPDWLLWVEFKVIPGFFYCFCADKVDHILEGDTLDSGRDLLASGGRELMDTLNGDIPDSGEGVVADLLGVGDALDSHPNPANGR